MMQTWLSPSLSPSPSLPSPCSREYIPSHTSSCRSPRATYWWVVEDDVMDVTWREGVNSTTTKLYTCTCICTCRSHDRVYTNHMIISTGHVTISPDHMITDLCRTLLNGQYGEGTACDVTGTMETDCLNQPRDTVAGEDLDQLVSRGAWPEVVLPTPPHLYFHIHVYEHKYDWPIVYTPVQSSVKSAHSYLYAYTACTCKYSKFFTRWWSISTCTCMYMNTNLTDTLQFSQV